MRRPLSPLGRGAKVGVAALGALVVAFAVFTIAGVGDGGSPAKPAAQAAAPATKPKTALQQYSEQAGKREAGLPAEAGGPPLSEEPPIPKRDFSGPIAGYKHYALRQSALLAGDVRRLRVALRSGDRARSRSAWTTAFARYLTLGAVYGLFGDLDADIDGQPGGLPRGTHDPHFRGLHRIELGLWTGAAPRSLLPVADRLASDVAKLPATIRHETIEPLDYVLRAHEILEDAQRDFLSGMDVPWSREGVAATAAGVTATQVVMNTLGPVLPGRGVGLTADAALVRLRRVLDDIAAAHHGRLPALDGLRRSERELLSGAMGAALEQLQQVPEALAVVDTPAIPRLR